VSQLQFPMKKWSETYITTLILPTSVTFEAIWGCSVGVLFPQSSFNTQNIPILGAGADSAAGAVFHDTDVAVMS